MNTTELIAMPYRLIRTPLTVVDSKLVRRLPADSRPRLVFERAVGSVDRLAGRLLHDGTLAQSGSERVADADKLEQAVELENEAALRRQAAADKAQTAKQAAADKRAQSRERASDAVQDAAKTEREAKQAAAAKARAQAAKDKQHVATRANQNLATIRQNLKQTEAVVEARETQAEEKAKAELEDASHAKIAAQTKREEADQLGELATAKKAARKSS